jgi:O-antigen/teichoic acid export membrane protein
VVALYATHTLTVGSAAAVTIAGALLSLTPAIPLLMSLDGFSFRRPMARAGLDFGVKAWAGGLAQLANLRLDQFLMITVVTPRVLGLYAVATTLSGVPTLMSGALAQPLMTRVAAGNTVLMARAVRMTLAVSTVTGLAMGLVAPVLLTVLFGPGFRDAIPMAIILLVGGVPLCGAMVLSAALQAAGSPLIPSIGEGLALVITVVGLLLLLGPLGGIGASIVSVAAYSTSFLFQLTMAHRRTGVAVSEFLIPARDDVTWARSVLTGVRGGAAALRRAVPGE